MLTAGASSGGAARRILQQGKCSHATSAIFLCMPMSGEPANTPNFTACVNMCPTAAAPCGFCTEAATVCAQVRSCQDLSFAMAHKQGPPGSAAQPGAARVRVPCSLGDEARVCAHPVSPSSRLPSQPKPLGTRSALLFFASLAVISALEDEKAPCVCTQAICVPLAGHAVCA